jgi:phosphatidylserine decarboxylase
MASTQPEAPRFRERLTGLFAPDVRTTAVPTILAGVVASFLAPWWVALPLLALGGFFAAFFRNPPRRLPDDPDAVLAPADGRVIAVGESELPDGRKALRIGIFLSVFDVHVNRAPVAGRVIGIARSGSKYLAAFNPDAEVRNVQLALDVETATGARVRVVQITGLIARRIVCHVQPGEWLDRGVRYGLIRFGSRTDVLLPLEAEACVAVGDRVAGGTSIVARLPGASGVVARSAA